MASKKDNSNPVRISRIAKALRIELTAEEVADRAQRAAHILSERDEKESAQKAQQKHAKSQIEELEAELRRLSNEVRDRATYTQVECEERHNYKRRKVVVVRLDSNEVIEERDMTNAESQRELDFNTKKNEPSKLEKDADDAGEKMKKPRGNLRVIDSPPQDETTV